MKNIEDMIYIIRGQKVMLDSDLAKLYEVETFQLNRQVRRNISRFPADFMFQLTDEEYQSLKCQNGISKTGRGGKQKQPLVFTENGVAMLSGLLNSERAIQVNIAIMRIFTRLRSFLFLEQELRQEMSHLKDGTRRMFKIVFEKLDAIQKSDSAEHSKKKKRIGLN